MRSQFLNVFLHKNHSKNNLVYFIEKQILTPVSQKIVKFKMLKKCIKVLLKIIFPESTEGTRYKYSKTLLKKIKVFI